MVKPEFVAMLKEADRLVEVAFRELRQKRVEGRSGGGMVQIVMNGAYEVDRLTLDPELIRDGDVEMIQELVKAAVNDGVRKVRERLRDEVGLDPDDEDPPF